MALVPETRFVGKIAPASADYPYGAARNVTTPGDETGTPLVADLVNDVFGFQQALLAAGGVVPSGVPDTALTSQYLDALGRILERTYSTLADLTALSLPAGVTARTKGYYPGWAASMLPSGGGIYDTATLASIRTAKGDGAWVPDERVNHTLANGVIAMLRFGNILPWGQAGAKGDGLIDDQPAIQACMNYMNSIGGGCTKGDAGVFLLGSSLIPRDKVRTSGESWEATELKAGGDYPVFDYSGSIGDQLARAKFTDMIVRGGGMGLTNAHGFNFEWANKPYLQNIQFRSCRKCVSAAYTIDIGMNYCFAEGAGADQNYIGLYLAEIDSVTYGVVDNTQILSNISFRQMAFAGVRAEGCTGMKATNVACLNGDYGWWFGEAALGANARLVRFLHLTNCFSDTNTLYGWRFARGAMAKITDVKMINCWAGSVSGIDAPAIFINGMEHSRIEGGVFALAKAQIIDISNSNDIAISIEGYDYNWGNNFHSAIRATSCERLILDANGFTPKASTTNTAYAIELIDSTECSVNGGAFEEYPGVLLHNTTKTTCTGFAVGAASIPVTETGTSNFNVVGGLSASAASVLIGAQTVEFPSAGTTNPRLGLVGGSTAAPAMYWAGSKNSGIYRRGVSGMGYSVAGVVKFAVEDDGTCIIGAHTASADAAVTGYITVKDQGGATRKIAVIP